MDNIKDENLKRLGKYIAEALMDQAMLTNSEDWIETNIKDHSIGELARCVTLNNLYNQSLTACVVLYNMTKQMV